MSILLILSAIVAGVVFLAVGLFSLAAILWGDLLEARRPSQPAGGSFRDAA